MMNASYSSRHSNQHEYLDRLTTYLERRKYELKKLFFFNPFKSINRIDEDYPPKLKFNFNLIWVQFDLNSCFQTIKWKKWKYIPKKNMLQKRWNQMPIISLSPIIILCNCRCNITSYHITSHYVISYHILYVIINNSNGFMQYGKQ